MITTLHRRLLSLLAALVVALAALVAVPAVSSAATFKILVFSKTTGFRHSSIPAGVAAIKKLGVDNGFTVDATEDDSLFTDTNLAQYKAVVFLSTTGDPVTTQGRKDAFQRYIKAGGGFVGIHAASDSGTAWSWYGGLVGAYFKTHPAQQNASVRVEDPTHPSTSGIAAQVTRFDEWYDFTTNPRGSVRVLANVDNASYTGSTMGADHPITWCKNYDGGRSWYTAMGHTDASFTEAYFLTSLLGGIRSAAGQVAADCSIPPVISLKAKVNSKYVSADNAGASALIANRATIGPWEKFDRINLAGGKVALRSYANNKFVSAANATTSLIANHATIGATSSFGLITNTDGTVALTASNGKYVCAENAGGSALIANRGAIGNWERFFLTVN
ncbi:MAG TPA: ThuA domain-containing protein [Actinokineospora sp.]|nr:ThuA domain-containing protein [Actinokineospora sp.]